MGGLDVCKGGLNITFFYEKINNNYVIFASYKNVTKMSAQCVMSVARRVSKKSYSKILYVE